MSETIYEALRESHEQQRHLLRRLVRCQPELRREVYEALKIELNAHAASEERYLYAPILMDDRGLSPSRHALHEHHEIDELLEKLDSLVIEGEAFLEHARALSETVHHHLREEEHTFFQMSGKILSDTDKVSLAKSYRKDFARMVAKLQGES